MWRGWCAFCFALLFFFGRCVNANATSGGAAGAWAVGWRGFVFLWCGVCVCVFCLDDDLDKKGKRMLGARSQRKKKKKKPERKRKKAH